MISSIALTILFAIGFIYLIQYPFYLKKAALLSKEAIYPQQKDEFQTILLPNEWKEMTPISKKEKSYQFVKWGTIVAVLLLTTVLIISVATDWLSSSLLNVAYLFIVIINSIKHLGNLFILPSGIILHSKYYPFNRILNYHYEEIIRWHELYGLHPRLNNGYKLTITLKNRWFQPNYLVIEDEEHLKRIITLLKDKGIEQEEKRAS